jgi:hypothetical protein
MPFGNQCMLEAFAGDYSHPGALLWLSRDPSLPWSILIAFVTFLVGNRFQSVKVFAACFMVSFLPLAIVQQIKKLRRTRTVPEIMRQTSLSKASVYRALSSGVGL